MGTVAEHQEGAGLGNGVKVGAHRQAVRSMERNALGAHSFLRVGTAFARKTPAVATGAITPLSKKPCRLKSDT
jgi:hypothetical protein